MIQTIKNAWRIPELRKKILFTALIVLVFRLGAAIPVPFVSIGADGLLGSASGSGTFFDYINMISGNAFNFGTIFAMSITPYINSSIIIQLLTVAIPFLERLSKEGEEGRKKIAKITRYTTIILGLLQGTAYYVFLRSQKALSPADNTFAEVFQAISIILILTAGTAVTMWLGEQINDKGIGNGISILLFAGIVSRIPAYVGELYSYIQYRDVVYYILVPIAVVCMLLLVVFIVWMDNAERRIPVQYSKRVVGRKMYGGQSSHIPIKVNMSGVLPVIFASSILSLPTTIEMFVTPDAESGWAKFFSIFTSKHWAYSIIYFVLIIFFAYFYSSIQYNPIEMANNLSKNSGTIPGIRSGRPTSDYIAKVISKIVLLGALLLSVVALFPILFSQLTNVICVDLLGKTSGVSISLGGTSIIILVGVALETVQQLESQMMMRHYKGFLD